MNIAFYIDEMNLRGVANSSYKYAYYNERLLKNKSLIFYSKEEKFNKTEVISKFKKKFKVIGVNGFKEMDHYGKKDTDFTANLVKWAEVIRKTFFDGGVDEIIATRRLVHIINAFAIFNNKLKAVEVCINRFDDDTKKSFLDLYTKVDAGVSIEELNQGSSNDDEELISEDE